MDFLEELDELADAAEASSFYDNEGGGGRAGCSGQELDRRKRSFKVAGDMSTALKLFHSTPSRQMTTGATRTARTCWRSS